MDSLKLAVANLKGGCGKSTLALNLAAGLTRRASTALLDADPQGTLVHWVNYEDTAGMPHVMAVEGDVAAAMRQASESYRYVVIDCPPALGSGRTESVLAHADMVLIPVLPSPPDLWSSARMVEAVHEARRKNPELRAYLVRNQVEAKSALSRAMRQALKACELPVLESALGRRAAYRWASLDGISVYHFGARGEKAVADIESIIEEVLNHD